MNNLLPWIPALPLAGFLLLALWGRKMPRSLIAVIGAGSITLSALLTMYIGIQFLQSEPEGGAYTKTLWRWFSTSNFQSNISLSIDALSLVFVFIITFVGSLIHIYSTAFMQHDRDYARFFASMNLFVCSMLVLVMADNLLLMYLGWEGVGLCSYLLIGFWYETPANCRAANKAFYITRIGDTAMAIGLFMLFRELGTLHIQEILQRAPGHFTPGSAVINTIAILLLAGGMGKSAQIPFQTWLPDAMAGPSPVSALIHAATMVTAGVYLVARTHVLFELSPLAMSITAIVGAVTLFVGGCTAMVQTDIKRVLAYSTMSQIGYMFLALGVGAWSAAIFHFFTHAFFKALLFLAAGVVIERLHHEHNIFKMGGLKNRMPVVFWTFMAGAAALAALPLVTSGFFSKDQILWLAFSSQQGNPALWLTGLAGACITGFYTARLVLVVFWGEPKTEPTGSSPSPMIFPLIILAILSVVAGYIEWPHNLLHLTFFSDLVQQVLPETLLKPDVPPEIMMQLAAVAATLFGIYVGYMLYFKNPAAITRWKGSEEMMMVRNFLFTGWGFDKLYEVLFVKPFLFITSINKADILDQLNKSIARGSQYLNKIFSVSQNGSLRLYVAGVLIGIIFILSLQLFL